MAKQKIPLEEQETIITWDRGNPIASIYTYDPKTKRKLETLKAQFPDIFTLIDNDKEWGCVTYEFPSNLVVIRKPRELTEATRKRMKEAGKRLSKTKRPEEESANHLQAF